MENYEKAQMEIIEFETEDVIETSGGGGDGEDVVLPNSVR